MAMPSRALTDPYQSSRSLSLITSITSLLQTLNPRKPYPSKIDPSPLNQFSPHLNPDLVIQVIKHQPNPYHALIFFSWASNPNPNPNNYFHTHRCYLAITDHLLTHSLFSAASSLLQEHEKLCDFMVGKLIKAYGDRGNVRAAIFWFHKAKVIENGRCLYSYNAILGVLVRKNSVHLAKTFFDQLVKEGVVRPDISSYTTMIRGFCKMGMIVNAKKVFDEMACEPNLVTYNTIINGFCKKGDMESARGIVDEMMGRRDCLPDTVTYTTLIDGFCKKGDLDEAMKCMDQMMKRGCEPNVLTYNAIIYGLCLKGNVDEAKRMMTKMRLNGLKDNVGTHTSILKGLSILGKSEEAVAYLKEMISLGMKPDVKPYGVVVNEYCKMKKPDEAINLLKEMRARGTNPGVMIFNAVFRVLVEFGVLDKAILLLKQMPQMGCFPNFISYSIVVSGLCRVRGRMQEVEELVGDMLRNGHKLDATIYSCIVKGYCEDGNESMAMRIFNEAIDGNYIINVESFSFFAKALCGRGKANEVQKMFEEMCRRCSVVDVDSYRRVLDEHLCVYRGK